MFRHELVTVSAADVIGHNIYTEAMADPARCFYWLSRT